MSLPSLFTWKRGWNKRNLKTGQIFEIKRDAVKVLKAYDCRHFYDSIQKFDSMHISQNVQTLCLFLLIYDKIKKRRIYWYSAVQRVDSDY